MAKKESTINSLLHTIIKKVDEICIDKSYPPFLLNYLYLMVYGMISAYGVQYSDLIYSILEENDIILGKENFKKYNDKSIANCADSFLSSKKPCFVLQKIIKKENTYKINYQMCLLDVEKLQTIHPIFILEFIIHEFNHILTSKQKTFFYINDKLACRCGVFQYVLSQSQNAYSCGKTLSEVINTLQTEDIIKEILQLPSQGIFHVGIVSILKNLRNQSFVTYTCPSYINETSLYRELYNIPAYKEFINNATLEGDIDSVMKDFDENVGTDAYVHFTTLYDHYSQDLQTGKKSDWDRNNIQTTAILAKEVKSLLFTYKEKKYPSKKWV